MYLSGRVRMEYIRRALASGPSSREVTHDDVFNSPDMVVAVNRGQHVDYFEFWVRECFEALSKKEEYGGLTQAEMLEKFVRERMASIGRQLGLRVSRWWYEVDNTFGFSEWMPDWNEGVLRVVFERKAHHARTSRTKASSSISSTLFTHPFLWLCRTTSPRVPR